MTVATSHIGHEDDGELELLTSMHTVYDKQLGLGQANDINMCLH